MRWSAAQYTRFEDERTRPVRDLLAQLLNRTAARVVDLGCGPGNTTERLQELYPDAAVTGIDSSMPPCSLPSSRGWHREAAWPCRCPTTWMSRCIA